MRSGETPVLAFAFFVCHSERSEEPASPASATISPSTTGASAMLDVHPPHKAAHTFKDFFIHIATIVIGLLIAVGLEQTV
jgi:hypothetical protein